MAVRTCGALLLALCTPFAIQAAAIPALTDLAETKAFCPPIKIDESNLHDYRGRDSTPFEKWSYQDNWRAHTQPAISRIRSGDLSRPVMADIAFTLTRWPNHLHGLKALVDYTLGGGKAYEYPSIQCFFASAQRLYADDVTVYAVEGYYYTKIRQFALAEQAYRTALDIDKDSIDVHYSLGLLYFETGDFEAALQQAWTAYAGGYPLPGLRRKLEQAGHWRDPAKSTAAQ